MSGQRRDRRGRFAEANRRAPVPTAVIHPVATVEKAEQARATGMRGLHRLFVERALEVLDAEVERGGDERLADAVAVVRGLRSRERLSQGVRDCAADWLAYYAGTSDAVSHAAGVALAEVQRKGGRNTVPAGFGIARPADLTAASADRTS